MCCALSPTPLPVLHIFGETKMSKQKQIITKTSEIKLRVRKFDYNLPSSRTTRSVRTVQVLVGSSTNYKISQVLSENNLLLKVNIVPVESQQLWKQLFCHYKLFSPSVPANICKLHTIKSLTTCQMC